MGIKILMKKQNLRIALAQINCTVGDLKGNSEKILEFIRKSEELGVDIVSFPELAITGYPPEDLLYKPKFISDNLAALKQVVKVTRNIAAIVGFVDREKYNLYNAAGVIYRGRILGVYRKMFLPNYGVFDERRYFQTGKTPLVFRFGRIILGVNICEDIWHLDGPVKFQAESGAGIIFNINASPYHTGKIKERENIIKKQAEANRVFVAYTNLIGGQDELVFDGQSMVVDKHRKIIARAQSFKEDLLILDLDIPADRLKSEKRIIIITNEVVQRQKAIISRHRLKPLEYIAEVYHALLLGLRDYVAKNGFQKAVIGLSGGIDSALVAALAVDALGRENVTCVFMPSRYSSEESIEDALQLTKSLDIKLLNISIEEIYKTYLIIFEPYFAGREKDITEENLQARIRGNILMSLSNKFGWLVLTTGNKSEMSTGYATLYGDMAGGFAIIKDVPKTLVYQLAKYRNSLNLIIPQRTISKEPTAELKPDQKDSDSLPVYEILDPILKFYIEKDVDLEKIISLGFKRDVVSRVLELVDKSEYKRRQSPPGIKITPKSFGRDRRMPITNKYKGW